MAAVLFGLIHGIWMTVDYSGTDWEWTYIFKWSTVGWAVRVSYLGTLNFLQPPVQELEFNPLPGFIAGVTMLLLYAFAYPTIRRKAYWLFQMVHNICFIALMVFIFLHSSSSPLSPILFLGLGKATLLLTVAACGPLCCLSVAVLHTQSVSRGLCRCGYHIDHLGCNPAPFETTECPGDGG